MLHPGRKFAVKLADSGITEEFVRERVADYLAGRPLKKLPRKLAEELAAEEMDSDS